MEKNGFDLDAIQLGLQSEFLLYKKDDVLKKTIKALGEKYLKDGSYLLHGDYYPGSFLKTNSGVKIIDPEFCFYGLAEFDLGVLIAHLKLSQQSNEFIDIAIKNYEKGEDFQIKFEAKIEDTKNVKTDGAICPKCKKGKIIKGKSAFGCSEWKNGCNFRTAFDSPLGLKLIQD